MLVRYRTPDVDHQIDRMFRQMTGSWFDTPRLAGPVVDGAWVDDAYVFTVDLPGVPADAVSVDVAGRTLSISVEHDGMSWQRSLRLGNRLDADQVTAHHVDGRLTVRIGTIADPERRSISISTERPAIETTSSDAGAAEADQIEASSND